MTIAATAEHVALLKSRVFWSTDLFVIALLDGTVVRYTSGGLNVSWGGATYSGAGPLIRRGSVRLVRGLESDSLSITVTPRDTDLLLGVPWVNAVRNGALDGARIELWRAHAAAPGAPIVGAVLRYSGPVEDVDLDLDIKVTVKSDIAKLDAPFPRAVWQPGCDRTLFDAGCGVARAAFQNTGAVVSGSTSRMLKLSLGTAKADGYYSAGELFCVSGANAGARRTIRLHDAAGFTLAFPLPNAPTVGDTFVLWPGCARTKADCGDKFSNVARFRGEPYVPAPETVL